MIEEVGSENLAPGQGALFTITRAKRMNDTTMSVNTSTIGIDPSAVGPETADLVVVFNDGKWTVDPTLSNQP
ncbi:hypothetical protein [Blastopirellula marina]|uniref:Uncharacterized protein n=1 Tax=Blastopirellula marina TaxID=124 RepID=A0A2S8FN74_9BACT|nr:hypothetical protein [Blastopirellula marina]PQO33655.1 hypothetical protein C5Y98_15560 [Blastopirellula marina]PTL43442.1 hypothetical protein C5Y97_15570 [Blastopirellula marina]